MLNRRHSLLEVDGSEGNFCLDQLLVTLGMSCPNLLRQVEALSGPTAHEFQDNSRPKQAIPLLQASVSIRDTADPVDFESRALRQYWFLKARSGEPW